MVDRITMSKGITLGYGNKNGELVGRRWGFDIVKRSDSDRRVHYFDVYDRNKTKRVRDYWDEVETYHRIAASLILSKMGGAWHVDLVEVDSRYKGRKLAKKLYAFLIKELGITLMAGGLQSPGGRYIWNTLIKDRDLTIYAKKSRGSKVFDFPKAGKRELVSKMFDLYDSEAEIFAVAA